LISSSLYHAPCIEAELLSEWRGTLLTLARRSGSRTVPVVPLNGVPLNRGKLRRRGVRLKRAGHRPSACRAGRELAELVPLGCTFDIREPSHCASPPGMFA
jgi:hypothetical protein